VNEKKKKKDVKDYMNLSLREKERKREKDKERKY